MAVSRGRLAVLDVLICENGTNPVDRPPGGYRARVARGGADDRRRVTLTLTPAGRAAEVAVRAIEEELHRQIDAALEAAATGASSGEDAGPADGDEVGAAA